MNNSLKMENNENGLNISEKVIDDILMSVDSIDDILMSVDSVIKNGKDITEETKREIEREKIEPGEKSNSPVSDYKEQPNKITEEVEEKEIKLKHIRAAKNRIISNNKKKHQINYSKLDIKGMPSNLIVVNDKNGEFKYTDSFSLLHNIPAPINENRIILDVTSPISHCFNPLVLAYDSHGNINDASVYELVELIMKSFEPIPSDYSSFEEAFLTMLIYYTLEEDREFLENGFEAPVRDEDGEPMTYPSKETRKIQGMDGGRCLSTILKLVQEAKVSDDDDEKSTLTVRLDDFFYRKPNNKTKSYYKTLLLADYITTSKISFKIASNIQYFASPIYDHLTRTSRYWELNLSVDNVLMQPQDTFYLDLVIPNKKVMTFLAEAIRIMIDHRKKDLSDKWFIGSQYKKKSESNLKAIFGPFDTEKDAVDFFECATADSICSVESVNRSISYNVCFKGKSYRQSFLKESLTQELERMSKLYIWRGI